MKRRAFLGRVAVWSLAVGGALWGVPILFPNLAPFKLAAYLVVPFFFASLTGYMKHWSGSSQELTILRELSSLGDEYLCVTNMPVPGGGGDIDLILYGPHGALVIESKCYAIEAGCEGDKWFLVRDGGRRQPIKSVSNQLKRNSKALDRFLQSKSNHTTVGGAIVFNRNANLKLMSPTEKVLRVGELLPFIAQLPPAKQTVSFQVLDTECRTRQAASNP